MTDDPLSSIMRVTVGIPTYLRPMDLSRTLDAVCRQADEVNRQLGAFIVDILVVDNDPNCTGRTVVERTAAIHHGLELRYAVEPRPGIAAVRNRCLDECRSSQLLVSIDDDETPQEAWLSSLLSTWQDTRAAIVSGRVVAQFEGELDRWIESGRFFVRRNMPTGSELQVAAAGNLLIDLVQVRALGTRFDDRFGLTGGEDTLFTREIARAGRRMVWCAESSVIDMVPRSRMSRRWVLERAWSHGNAAALIEQSLARSSIERGVARVAFGARGIGTAGYGLGRLALGTATTSAVHRARGLRAIYRGSGMALGSLGFAYYEYGRRGRKLSRLAHPSEPRPDGDTGSHKPLVVLESFPEPRPTTNPYLVMLKESLEAEPDMSVLTFSWRAAFVGKYHVFHVHWPEILLRGSTPLKQMGKQVLFAILLGTLRARRIPIVRTKHNLELPDGIGLRQRMLLRWCETWTTLYVRLNHCTPIPAGKLHVTIPHGHYRDWYAGCRIMAPEEGRIGYVGLIRRYKGVEDLIEAFRDTECPSLDLSLHISGSPSTSSLENEIIALSEGDRRIHLDLRFLSDDELVETISRAELMVLPYRLMHNSGGALACLSLDRPILVPDNDVNRQLREECGREWVHCYAGELALEDILAALKQTRSDGLLGRRPDLRNRDWTKTGSLHREAYNRALAAVPGRNRSF